MCARIEGVALGLIGEAEVAANLGRGGRDQPAESIARPSRRCCGSDEHELLVVVDRDQLDRLEPDREHVLAEASLELTADLPPDAEVLSARDVEASTDLVEVDAYRSSSAPPSIAEVALLDDHRAPGPPPSRGLGGFLILGFRGSLPARALGGPRTHGWVALGRGGRRNRIGHKRVEGLAVALKIATL